MAGAAAALASFAAVCTAVRFATLSGLPAERLLLLLASGSTAAAAAAACCELPPSVAARRSLKEPPGEVCFATPAPPHARGLAPKNRKKDRLITTRTSAIQDNGGSYQPGFNGIKK